MKRETGKVFFASALGAGIGALVALEVVSWLWWVGLLVGGLVGYLSYEFKAVLAALPKAWRAARGWQTPPHYWRNVGWVWLGITGAISGLAVLVHILFWSQGIEAIADVSGTGIAILLLSAVAFVVVAPALLMGEEVPSPVVFGKTLLYWSSPLTLFFYHLPRGLWWIIRRTPKAVAVAAIAIGRGLVAFVRFLPQFGWQVFIRIHSEMRILCGTDAALGAAVGYFAGSALLGAVVGGLFGVVNYALVTERWLRPRGYLPVRAK